LFAVTCANSSNKKQQANDIKLDFGSISSDSVFTKDVKFYNNTGSDLYIKSVEAECGCMITSFPKEKILPGSFGNIHIVYDPSKSTDSGVVQRWVAIRTSGALPISSIQLKGYVNRIRRGKPIRQISVGRIIFDTLRSYQ
jgi:hypothetical protein